MTDPCPDCGRPIAGGEETWIAIGANVSTHCFGHISGDYVGRVMCKDNTIARLRRELANALSIANSRTYCMDSPEVLKARVGELEKELAAANERATEIADDLLGLQQPDQSTVELLDALESGYNRMRTGLHRELAEARAIGELERDLIEQTLAWQEYDRSRPPKDPGFTTVPFVKWMSAVDRVIAARAATGRTEGDDMRKKRAPRSLFVLFDAKSGNFDAGDIFENRDAAEDEITHAAEVYGEKLVLRRYIIAPKEADRG